MQPKHMFSVEKEETYFPDTSFYIELYSPRDSL